MHALVLLGNGEYYASAIFAHRCRIKGRLFPRDKSYWIVWDQKKERLIRLPKYRKGLDHSAIIVNADESGWIKTDELGSGHVDFLTDETLDALPDLDVQPEEILARCRELDESFVYQEIREIQTEKDANDFSWSTMGLHDGRIVKEELLADGTLHVQFEGVWDCEAVDLWFSGDVEYDTASKFPDADYVWWMDCSVVIKDGFVLLIEFNGEKLTEIVPGVCYFKARRMKYRLTPR